MFDSKYEFGDRGFDGSTKVVKDGKDTFCPKAPIAILPAGIGSGINSATQQVLIYRPACFKECPHLQKSSRTNKDTGETEPGYAMTCMDKPIFIKIIDNKKVKNSLNIIK
jgi:hypothetical protein